MEGSTSNPNPQSEFGAAEPKGKLLNLMSRCIGKPIFRLWSNVDIKQRLACATVRKIDFAAKCLKRLPDVSLSCHVSASFSVNSAKNSGDFDDSEKRERCRKIAKIEYEIRNLERALEKRESRV